MIPKHLTTAAAVASATLLSASTGVSGFLIPPELSDTDIAFAQEVASVLDNNGLDPITASASQHQLIELACPGCPVLIKDRHHNAHHPKVLTDKPNHLELDFKIDHSSDSTGDRLLVNGFELFPNADPLRSELWAGQVLEGEGHVRTGKVENMHHDDTDSDHDSGHEDDKKHKNRKHKNRKHRNRKPKTLPQNLGFGLRTSSLPQGSFSDPAEQAQEIIDLNLQILEVGNAFVQGIPAVEIKLLRDQVTNKLMIGNIETTSPNKDNEGVSVPFMGVAPDAPAKEECESFLCKLLEGFREKVKEGKEAWEKKMKNMGGCHSGHGVSAPAATVEEEGEKRKMPVAEIDIERIDFTEGEDGTWEIFSSPVEEKVEEEEKKIKDLLDEVPQQEDESSEGHGWHGHGHQGGMHRYEHSWGQLMKSITTHVLLPVLVGIIAGVSVSFIGIAFGTLIVALYRFFYRRGGSVCRGRKCRRHGGSDGAGCKRAHRHRHSRHGKDEAGTLVEEKAGLLAETEVEGEAPPAYEDAKVAEEGEVRK